MLNSLFDSDYFENRLDSVFASVNTTPEAGKVVKQIFDSMMTAKATDPSTDIFNLLSEDDYFTAEKLFNRLDRTGDGVIREDDFTNPENAESHEKLKLFWNMLTRDFAVINKTEVHFGEFVMHFIAKEVESRSDPICGGEQGILCQWLELKKRFSCVFQEVQNITNLFSFAILEEI
jgi:hypothetical protein